MYVTRQDYDLMQAVITLIHQKSNSALQEVFNLIDQGARWDVDIEQKFYTSTENKKYVPVHKATVPLTSLEVMLVGAPLPALCAFLEKIGPLPDVSYNNLFRISDVFDYPDLNNNFKDFLANTEKNHQLIKSLGLWSTSTHTKRIMNAYTSFWTVLEGRNDVMTHNFSELMDMARTLNTQPKMQEDEFLLLMRARDNKTPLNFLMLMAIGLDDNAKKSPTYQRHIQNSDTQFKQMVPYIQERLALEALNLSSDKSSPTKKM